MAETVRDALIRHLDDLSKLSAADRLKKRYEKFRAYGHFTEMQSAAVTQTAASPKAKSAVTATNGNAK
jgi:hypothetical protein